MGRKARINHEMVIALYVDLNFTLAEIADQMHATKPGIKHILDKHNVKLRPQGRPKKDLYYQ